MGRQVRLLRKLERHIESHDVLGFDIGDGEDVLDFLARLEMGVVEHLLRGSLAEAERELVLNWIEERKGRLKDHELPRSEAERRAEVRRPMQRRRR